jgi:hypothetical protein
MLLLMKMLIRWMWKVVPKILLRFTGQGAMDVVESLYGFAVTLKLLISDHNTFFYG